MRLFVSKFLNYLSFFFNFSKLAYGNTVSAKSWGALFELKNLVSI